jgi:hypothetical protein
MSSQIDLASFPFIKTVIEYLNCKIRSLHIHYPLHFDWNTLGGKICVEAYIFFLLKVSWDLTSPLVT